MTPGYDIVDPRFAELLDTGTPPERIAHGHTWTEGPVWIEDTLYFNDIPARQMLGWQEGRGVGVVLPDSEFANGNTRDAGGPGGTDLFITSSDSVYRVRTSRRDAAA